MFTGLPPIYQEFQETLPTSSISNPRLDFESDSSLMALVLKTLPETKTQIDSSFSAESLPLYTHLKKLSVKYGANIERNLGVSLKT